MLKLYESTPDTNVMSLRTGTPIGTIVEPVINPNNLYIEGWVVNEIKGKEHLILLSNDIREVVPQGFAVNDHEVLTNPSELVRLKEIFEINFQLLNLKVTSESGKNYGKVNDYAYETKNFFVQKLYAGQPLVKNFSGGNTSIDRSQIIEITNKRVVIEDPTEKSQSRAGAPSLAG